jgi:hypothetical protein
MNHETNHPTPGGDQQWPFTLAQQEVITVLPQDWQDQVNRRGPVSALKDIEPKYHLPGITLNSALLGLVAAYHGEDAPVLKRATTLLDAQTASSKAQQEQRLSGSEAMAEMKERLEKRHQTPAYAVKQNPPYTSVEHQLLGMLPKKIWHQAETRIDGLAGLIYTTIPEISGYPRLTQIVALIGITRDDVWMYQAAQKAELSWVASQDAIDAVRQRRKILEQELADSTKVVTPPEPPTEALTYESFTRALQYFNNQSRKSNSTAHLRADQQAWERDSLDYVKPESLAETFNVPERFVTPAQLTWDPVEPATTWTAVPEKAAKPVVQDFASERIHDEPRLVPTREQETGLGGARVLTNLAEFTTPQGPVVEEDPTLFDTPEPREELAEQLKGEVAAKTGRTYRVQLQVGAQEVEPVTLAEQPQRGSMMHFTPPLEESSWWRVVEIITFVTPAQFPELTPLLILQRAGRDELPLL